MRRGKLLVGLAIAATVSFCGFAEIQERRAITFIDSFRPLLEQYHAEHGRYPAALPKEWYPSGDLPALVRPDFYLVFDDGKGYLMRFVNPVRLPFDDVVAFQSDIGHWSSWDGY